MKKTNSITFMIRRSIYRLVETLLGISIVLALVVVFTGCSDKDFGYTKDELFQAAQESRYDKEFQRVFPDVDPSHTWMCEPDTFYYPVQTVTRGMAATVPVINTSVSEWMTMEYEKVNAALNYMKEDADNRGKCAQDFEYIALQETTYDIYPTFWGRKFCDANKIGIYYIDGSGKKVDMAPFWEDTTGKNNITAIYKDGFRENLINSTKPITDDRNEAWNETKQLTHSCITCGGDGKINYNRCPNCTNGKSPVVSYEFPKYTLTVPEGVKWGIYLETNKTQDNPKRIRWYSSASYNADKVSAAATFTYDGVTYCSFEDAPHNTHNGSGNGNCSCGYGHYDRDFNDIVLTITPRPIESTYRAIKYRVMCEDLGGTFDWDFNDVVYDVIYEEGKDRNTKATLSITIQAIGGTLPIRMYYGTTPVVPNDQELHEFVSGQQANEDELYRPINVAPDQFHSQSGGQESVVSSQIVQAQAKPVPLINFDQQKVDNIDIRDYAKDIVFYVSQANGTVTDVAFPQEQAGSTPQCFMTSVGTEWAAEMQKITNKYPQFASWVSHFSPTQEWWLTDPNF